MKFCYKCQSRKPENDFWKNQARCKSCQVEHKRNYLAIPGNREKAKEYNRAWFARNSRRKEDYRLKNLYGISIEEYEMMYKRQGRKCAICRQDRSEMKLCVDHDHITGEIRGLLCQQCNKGLGDFADSVEYLKSAVAYLQSKKGKEE